MPKLVERLSPLKVSKTTTPGLYPDGAGLYLQVRGKASRSWLFRYMLNGKPRTMGLGSYPDVSLEAARNKASDCRRQRQAGIDPIAARETEKAAAERQGVTAPTFKVCATQYITAHTPGWRNEKHAEQWTNTLEAYAYPFIGELPVDQITTDHMLEVLQDIWLTKTETASRVRGRIENILDWARVRGHRSGENPARWRGHMDKLLPKRSKVRKVQHHPALPYSEIPAFMESLRAKSSTAARALEYIILTVSRSAEAREGLLSEVRFPKADWTVPASRMKADREHRVPLVPRAVDVIRAVTRAKDEGHLFPGLRKSKGISETAIRKLLDDLGQTEITIHGFRATFKTWAGERTNFAREIVEAAMAHVIGDKAEQAYSRGDLYDKRRRLMEAWAGYCSSKPVKKGAPVTHLKAG